jgi:galactokinase/mevalonate kinase-like predicted kinase
MGATVRYKLTIPARINILGNPGDANEGDFSTLSAAVEMRAGALVEPAEGLVFEWLPGKADTLRLRQVFPEPAFPLNYTGDFDLMKGAINRLYMFSPEFRQKFSPQAGVRIVTWSDVPRQSGLGGSSMLVLLVLAGLRQFYDLDRRKHNDYILAELAQRVEAKELGITCGFADRYVPLFGGLAYLDYRGKLHHQAIGQEPLVTYERLDAWAADLPLVAITTGIQHDSGDVHGRMRPRYVGEWDAWLQQGGDPPFLVQLMSAAWGTAWQGKLALLEGDLETFGGLMNENHRLVDQMMTSCGFLDGAGWANNLFIETARSSGALGAKLTGAGGGGSVFALTRPGEEQKLVDVWRQVADQAGLGDARIFCPMIARQGLVVETIETKGER